MLDLEYLDKILQGMRWSVSGNVVTTERTYSEDYLWRDRQEVPIPPWRRTRRHSGRYWLAYARHVILDDSGHCEGGCQKSSQCRIFKSTLAAETDAQHLVMERVPPNRTLTGS